MNFGLLFLKKENITKEEEIDNPLQKCDRLTFMGVLPESSYIHTVHNGQRNQEEAKIFVQQMKDNSDGQAPFIESDGWFLQLALQRRVALQAAIGGKRRHNKDRYDTEPRA